MSDGWCMVCEKKPSLEKDGQYTYLCGPCTLKRAGQERIEILRITNDPGIQWKVRRALLREKFGFADVLIDELVGKTEPASDY